MKPSTNPSALITHLLAAALCTGCTAASLNGPLRVCPENPRYFADNSGRAVYLTGSHHWYNLVDMGPTDPPPPHDYDAYLDWMVQYHHNFMRLWTWELTTWNTLGNAAKHRNENTFHHVTPHIWSRTGPGKALDGKPKFDLSRFNPAYFDRLRQRAVSAAEKEIYVAVMLFEGWSMQRVDGGFKAHPFHPGNNINGVDGDQDGDGKGLEVHELVNSEVTRLQEAYTRQVIDTLNDLDNVLYEISNENHPESTAWQYHMIRFIQDYEKGKPKQHPVGMTFQFKGGSNKTLFDSPADWISPNNEGGYRDNPPANNGQKVILSDTDHLWGIGGNASWVWKSFCRGLNPIFMDPYDGLVLGQPFDAHWEPVRRSMGYSRLLAQRLDLTTMTPQNQLASTGYCLARAGRKYLIYLPEGKDVTVDLSGQPGAYKVRWFEPGEGTSQHHDDIQGDQRVTLSSPFGQSDVVLVLLAAEE